MSFSEWMRHQRSEIGESRWLHLNVQMAQLDTQIRREHYESALRSLPDMYRLVQGPDLRGWLVLMYLVEGGLQLSATGNLNRVLELAIKSVTVSQELKGEGDEALRLGSRLLLLRSWMKRDEVGYAKQVLAAGNEVLDQGDLGAWRFWFNASNAWALWALGRQEEADHILADMLAKVPPSARQADGLEGQAYMAYRMRQTEEASRLYQQAAELFEADHLRHAAVRCRINRGICLHDAGLYGEARQALEDVRPRLTHIMNPHYEGLLNCFMGRIALAVEDYSGAIEPLEQALVSYKGRGWLRDEAHIAIDLVQARQALGRKGGDWDDLLGHARTLLADLRSDDLSLRLEHLLAD